MKTLREGLPDGLYVDAGASSSPNQVTTCIGRMCANSIFHISRIAAADNMLRVIGGRIYSEQDLTSPTVLAALGLNQREIDFFRNHPWWDAQSLYLGKYSGQIVDEYQPFVPGLKGLDQISTTELMKRDGASDAFLSHAGGGGSALQSVWHAGILKRPAFPPGPHRYFV